MSNIGSRTLAKNFFVSIGKGCLLLACVPAGGAVIGLVIYGAGSVLPSMFGYWPINDVRIQLNEINTPLLNGLAWFSYLLLALLALVVLAFIGGFHPSGGDGNQDSEVKK